MALIAYEPAASGTETLSSPYFDFSQTVAMRLIPLIRLTDGNDYAVMTHELASIPVRTLGTEFCEAAQYGT